MILIGTSAGGVEALLTLAQEFPPELPAAVFVTIHLASGAPSLLPELLRSRGPLPVVQPTERTSVKLGTIYIAPPDHHMVLEDHHIHVVRGPKENGFRPAIDAMFRTAARAYAGRTIGVILTGMLDDGTAGLLAIKRRGGLAVVQDPVDAAFPSMPRSALRYVNVDHVCGLRDIVPLLSELVQQRVEPKGGTAVSDELDAEAQISAGEREALEAADELGTLAPFSCPDCGGVLMEFFDGDLLRFRCQVGHVFSRESALANKADQLDRELWAAYRALDEHQLLLERLAQDAQQLDDRTGAQRFQWLARQTRERKEQIRLALLKDDEVDLE
jgi:two-component system chemotaxis response regulator CheB